MVGSWLAQGSAGQPCLPRVSILTFIDRPTFSGAASCSFGSSSELGKKCYEIGPVRSVAAVAAYLEKAMQQGKLKQADARIAAVHLKGLMEAEWLEPYMFQALAEPSEEALRASVRRAVTVFMAAYGPAAGRQG